MIPLSCVRVCMYACVCVVVVLYVMGCACDCARKCVVNRDRSWCSPVCKWDRLYSHERHWIRVKLRLIIHSEYFCYAGRFKSCFPFVVFSQWVSGHSILFLLHRLLFGTVLDRSYVCLMPHFYVWHYIWHLYDRYRMAFSAVLVSNILHLWRL